MSAPNAAISPLIKVILMQDVLNQPRKHLAIFQQASSSQSHNNIIQTNHSWLIYTLNVVQTARWSALIAGVWWGNKRFAENKVVEDEVRSFSPLIEIIHSFS